MVGVYMIWNTHDDFIISQQINLFLDIRLARLSYKSLVNKQLKLVYTRRRLLIMLAIVKRLLKRPLLIFLLVYHISEVRVIWLLFSLIEWLLLLRKSSHSSRIARCLYCIHIIIIWWQFLGRSLIAWVSWALRAQWLLWPIRLLGLITLISIYFQLALVILIMLLLLFAILSIRFLVSTWFHRILLLKLRQPQWLWRAYFSVIELIFRMLVFLVAILWFLLMKSWFLIVINLMWRCISIYFTLCCLHFFYSSQWGCRCAFYFILVFNRLICFWLFVSTYVTNSIFWFIWLIGISFYSSWHFS